MYSSKIVYTTSQRYTTIDKLEKQIKKEKIKQQFNLPTVSPTLGKGRFIQNIGKAKTNTEIKTSTIQHTK